VKTAEPAVGKRPLILSRAFGTARWRPVIQPTSIACRAEERTKTTGLERHRHRSSSQLDRDLKPSVRKTVPIAPALTRSIVRLCQSLTIAFARPASAFRFGATADQHANSQFNSALADVKKLNACAQIRRE